jgi:hypothetical protein
LGAGAQRKQHETIIDPMTQCILDFMATSIVCILALSRNRVLAHLSATANHCPFMQFDAHNHIALRAKLLLDAPRGPI